MPKLSSHSRSLRLALQPPTSSTCRRSTGRSVTSSPRRTLAFPRHGILSDPWLPTPSAVSLPTAFFSPSRVRRDVSGLGEGPNQQDHKPPDERVVKLGKTLRTLSPLLPTILYNTLPPEILAPSVNLHLFPSTHPHLPTVKGRTLYRAALWTVPVAWSSVPLVGNVKLKILSERMVRAGTILDPTHHDQHECGDERLVVRWQTEPRTDSKPFHEAKSEAAPQTDGASSSRFFDSDPGPKAGQSHLSSSSNGTNRGLSVLLGGEEPMFKLSKEGQFTGLFIFSFDEEGRILTHTIEHADEANGWDRTSKFVTLTDWLIGKARESLEPTPHPGLAISCGKHGLACHQSGRYWRQ
ncbi:hypothetical protein POX_e06412 [Penicillium oxalicum]|uniref:Chromosome transmission fidelity protein 4 n=1 Tax=Penicillium oxalicum (strain 114-2 / CGMCC 5302) TaxID=933388 RepID=S8AZL6_PENO1|nr:hypothetical protein POX_e06412 [Penicillium oxalicum]EPS27447.1 hypothetical protein PDE_02390 [Penicillium oxalicum 114-2]KAI2788397.1 hypothetical protein POX_e06412 [Penicillium oxalicum]